MFNCKRLINPYAAKPRFTTPYCSVDISEVFKFKYKLKGYELEGGHQFLCE